jgi:NAD(P)-dependent dehydrogenase (short-subunit alcohol dehydrogenase family)
MSDAASLEAPFRGQVVVLQGASGAVGGRLAERLFSAGARLALPVRRGWQVDRLATRLAELAPDRGTDRLIAEVGSTDSQAAAGFAKGTVDSLGPPAACISCSGAFAFAPIGEDSANTLYELFEANVSAPYTLLRAFVPGMKRRKSGRIVLVGAAAAAPGSDPTPGLGAYRSTKAALHELARSIAVESALPVHVVAPTVVDTPANREAMPDADRSDWVSIDAVCDALLRAAAGELGAFTIVGNDDA